MRPIERTALRTKSMSTSDAYLNIAVMRRHRPNSGRGYILFQLCKHLFDVLLIRKPVHDFQLGKFDIYWVIVLAEEHLYIVLEDSWSSLDYEQDVPQSNILHFRPRGKQGHCPAGALSTVLGWRRGDKRT